MPQAVAEQVPLQTPRLPRRRAVAQRLSVIVVNDHLYADGGADVVALNSAEQLAAAGVPVTLFVADRQRSDDHCQRRARLVCTGQNDLMHEARRGHAAVQGLWNLAAARAMRKLLAEHDPACTVVHLHSWTKSLSASVVREARAAGFSIVCTLHDYFAACPGGGFFDFQRGAVCRLRPMSGACVRTHCDSRSYAHKLYRVARQVAQSRLGGLPGELRNFISVSAFSASILRPYLPGDARLFPVRNPIDSPRGAPADVAANRNFVVVARLLQIKGQALFLEACRRAGAAAVCVGDGPDLEALRRCFPAARFAGQLPREKVVAELLAARALVMPSVWYETQGLVVNEAAALGVPAIVSDGCAAVDAVRHGYDGLHFASGDVDALTDAVRRLNDDVATAQRLGTQAYQTFWRDPPTPQAHAQALLDVYAQILALEQPLPARAMS